MWTILLLLLACDTDGENNRNTNSEDNQDFDGDGDGDGDDNNQPSSNSVTYYEDIQPMLAQNCTRCHVAGGLGVGDFTDLELLTSFAPSMLASIDAGRMPPPAADPGCNEYVGADALTISAAERDLLADWIDADMPMGDPADAPDIEPVSGELSDPDIVMMMPAPYTPTFEDTINPGNEYRCFVLDKPTDEAFYITSMAPVIDNSALVHHSVLFTMRKNAVTDQMRDPNGVNCIGGMGPNAIKGIIGAWAPGMLPVEFPSNAGLLIEANREVILQMHYYAAPDDGTQSDQSGYAFKTTDDVDTRVMMMPFADYDFVIPAGDDNYTITRSLDNNFDDAKILGTFPHMHVLGSRFDAKRINADGTETCLVTGEYDFDNQMTYMFNEPVSLNNGDKVEISCTWNNSTSNPDRYFDEPQDTRFGERTNEEMCYFFTLLTL
ncbi:MAG: hypothetical protein AAFV53_31295 [Myxococcota bacterium]